MPSQSITVRRLPGVVSRTLLAFRNYAVAAVQVVGLALLGGLLAVAIVAAAGAVALVAVWLFLYSGAWP